MCTWCALLDLSLLILLTTFFLLPSESTSKCWGILASTTKTTNVKINSKTKTKWQKFQRRAKEGSTFDVRDEEEKEEEEEEEEEDEDSETMEEWVALSAPSELDVWVWFDVKSTEFAISGWDAEDVVDDDDGDGEEAGEDEEEDEDEEEFEG